MRRAAYVLFFCGLLGFAQEPVQFEVASIRSSNSDEMGGPSGCQTGSGLMRCSNVTLKRCIQGAYGVGPNVIIGGPDWLESDRFQITARAAEPVGDSALMSMLKTLLAERFHLKFHREARPTEVLAIEVGKNGQKMEVASAGEGATTNSSRGVIDARAITMGRFAEVLSRQTDAPVVDHTGLLGAFNLKLQWTPESPRPQSDADPGVSIYTAIQEQLGLTLRSQRLPVEVLVIDHAEKPTEN